MIVDLLNCCICVACLILLGWLFVCLIVECKLSVWSIEWCLLVCLINCLFVVVFGNCLVMVGVCLFDRLIVCLSMCCFFCSFV